jgi:putative restriction endonuclease
MRAYVFPTDTSWSAYLRGRPELDNVNFWLPGGGAFAALVRGDRFVYRSKKDAGGRLIGGGLFDGFVRLKVSEAWAAFETANGCDSREELLAVINRYRSRNGLAAEADPTIGCILVRESFFVESDLEIPVPPGYPMTATKGRGYDDTHEDWSYLEGAFADLLIRARVQDRSPDGDITAFIDGPTRGEPRFILPRVGQRSFKALTLDGYHRRCAITGAKITPVLEAAHIRPVAHDGQHRLDNGLLLRSDVHTLFDNGYLGIDTSHRLLVSKRIRDDFGNGEEFYLRAGTTIDLPDRSVDRPHPDAIEWHLDTVFKAS